MMIPGGSVLPAQATTTLRVAVGDDEKACPELEVVELQEGGDARVVGKLTFHHSSVAGSSAAEIKVGLSLRSEGVLKVEALETSTKARRELIIGRD